MGKSSHLYSAVICNKNVQFTHSAKRLIRILICGVYSPLLDVVVDVVVPHGRAVVGDFGLYVRNQLNRVTILADRWRQTNQRGTRNET